MYGASLYRKPVSLQLASEWLPRASTNSDMYTETLLRWTPGRFTPSFGSYSIPVRVQWWQGVPLLTWSLRFLSGGNYPLMSSEDL